MAEGQAYIAMHWGAEYLGGCDSEGRANSGVNGLTQPRFCPTSKQPELKHAAVSITPVQLEHGLVAAAWLPADEALALRERLKPWMAKSPYAACVPFGREPDPQGRVGVLFRAARAEAWSADAVAEVSNLFGLDGDTVMRYDDAAQHQHRAMKLLQDGDDRRLTAMLLVGDTAADAWIRPLLQDDQPAQAFGSALLAPGAEPPVAVASRGKQVCTCFNVTEPDIVATLAQCPGEEDNRLSLLQSALKCGTNCGSCVPALRKLIRITPVQIAA